MSQNLGLNFRLRFQGASDVVANVRDTAQQITANLTNMATAGAVGIAALSSAAIGLAASLIKTSVEVANATDQIYEMHVKTGLAVETLSALDAGARLAGTDLEKLSAGLVIFDKNSAAAAVGMGKNVQAFKDLHVDLTNNEAALSAVFDRLHALGPGAEQTAEAVKFFGRSGAEMLKIVNEAGGSLDSFKQKLREAGLLMTTEEAEAAHKFEEDWRRIGLQFSALGRQFSDETIPAIDSLTKTLSSSMGSAQNDFNLAQIAGAAFAAQLNELTGAIQLLKNEFGPDLTLALKIVKESPEYQTSQGIANFFSEPDVPAPKIPPLQPVNVQTVSEEQQAEEVVQAAKNKTAQVERDTNAILAEQKRLRAENATTAAVAANAEIEATRRLTQAKVEQLMAEKQLLELKKSEETDLEKRSKLEGEIEDKDNEIGNERAKFEVERQNKLSEIRIEARRKAEEDAKKSLQQLIADNNSLYQISQLKANDYIEHQKQLAEAQVITWVEAYGRIKASMLDSFEERRKQLEGEKKAAGDDADAVAEITRQLALLKAKQELLDQHDTQNYFDAAKKDADDYIKKLEQILNDLDEFQKKALLQVTPVLEGPSGLTGKLPNTKNKWDGPWVDPNPDILNLQGNQIFDMSLYQKKPPPPDFKPIQSAVKSLENSTLGSFKNMAAGMGQLIASWATGAASGGQSFASLAKSVIGSLTAMAFTQGIIELAEAAAGLTPWGMAKYGPPAPHLIAAGYFFAAGAGASLLGAAFGGGSSATAASVGSGSTGAFSSTGTTSTNTQMQPIVQGRVGGAPDPNVAQPVHIILEVQPTEAFVVKSSVNNYKQNGMMRKIILHGAGELATI